MIILKATPDETKAVRRLTSCLNDHPSKKNKTCKTLLEKQGELISSVLLWTSSHGRASVSRPARTYLHCVDTRCNLEDQPGAMDDRDKWRERESGKSTLSIRFDNDDDDNIKNINLNFFMKIHLFKKIITGWCKFLILQKLYKKCHPSLTLCKRVLYYIDII